MKRQSYAVAAAFVVVAAAATSADGATAPTADAIARGKYLATIAGCHDCHTPKKMGPHGPEPDFSRALSGHPESVKVAAAPKLPAGPWIATVSSDLTAWSGPWGISYATNLTPDTNTGLGIWTEEMFIKALKTGRHMGVSRPILPPMPWPNYAVMPDSDLKALFAYLKSLPAIKNRVPEPVIAERPAAAGTPGGR